MGEACGTGGRGNKYVPYSVFMGKIGLKDREQLKSVSVDVWMVFSGC
jgi:hypothetical protein